MQSIRFFNSLFLTLLTTLYFSMFTGCSPQEEKTRSLRIGMNTWPGYEPFVLAKDLGYLADNVNISRVDSATDVIKAFRSDLIDIACTTLDEAIILKSKSKESIKIIAIMDISKGGDVIIARKDTGSMLELKGSRIGVESSTLGSFMLARAVDLTPGLELNDLKIVNLGYEYHVREFNKGNIDAVVTFEPVKTKLLKGYAHVLFDSSQIPGEILDVMIVKEKTIREKKSALDKAMKGWFRSVEYISREPNNSMKAMSEYEEISLDEFKIAYVGIEVPSLQENKRFMSEQLQDSIIKLTKILYKNKLITKEVVLKDFYSDEFIKRLN